MSVGRKSLVAGLGEGSSRGPAWRAEQSPAGPKPVAHEAGRAVSSAAVCVATAGDTVRCGVEG